jgi:hypothetical protein
MSNTRRAAIYVRVSTDRQTVENQVSALTKVASCRPRRIDQENNAAKLPRARLGGSVGGTLKAPIHRYQARLEIDFAACFQRHESADRKSSRDRRDEALDPVFVPDPASLEVRELECAFLAML